jgi:hypothetical protein
MPNTNAKLDYMIDDSCTNTYRITMNLNTHNTITKLTILIRVHVV